MAEEECPDAQLCQEGQCECFWRDGLTGDACDEWTARAVWHITGRALSVAIYFAAGLHTARVLSEAISYEWRRSRAIINGCTPSRTLGTLASCLLASAFGCASFSFAVAIFFGDAEIETESQSNFQFRVMRVTEGEGAGLEAHSPLLEPQPRVTTHGPTLVFSVCVIALV